MVKQRRGLPLSFYIVAFALALAIPAVIFAGAVTYRWVKAEQAHLEGTIDQLDDELVSSIDRFVAGQIAMLQALATSPALDAGEMRQFDEQARALVTLQGIHIVMRDMTGQQVINTRLPWGAALPKAVLDADRVAAETKQPYVSDLIVGAVTRTPLIVVNVPVLRDGAVRYILNASVPPQAIAAVVEGAGIAAPYSASVVDRKGLIIARSEMGADFLGKPHPAFADVTGPRGVWSGVNPQQVAMVGHYRQSALSGWFVSVGVRKAALEAPLTRSLWWLAGLGVVLGGLALALAVLVGRRIMQAQSDLAAAARAVGRGETIAPPQTAVREGNRIGEELAQASARLNEQAAALVEANRLLESKIEERTRDLAASEARARILSENASDVITLMDTSLRRLYASSAASDVMGYTPDELLGETPIDIVHPEDAEGLQGKLQALARGEVDQARSIHRFRHKRGSWIWVEVNFRLVRSQDGAPQEIVSVIRDISERRQLEEHLRESQKMEAVGQLTGGIAHEFNNLLMVVLGNAEVLAEEVGDPGLQKLALAIQGSAERGADLTQKLLAFGRRQSLRPERLDLSRVVADMVPLLRHALGRGIEIVTEGPAEPVFAVADSTLLQSSVLNLAINARDAMPGGGTVVIRTGERVSGPKDGGLPFGQPVAFVTVSDTGTGISPDVLERVFEPFFTTKEVGKGTGLGLSMVYGFTQQSGGHVTVNSQEGQGTAVTMLLRSVSAASARASAPVSAASPTHAQSGRILVIEDEPQVLEFVSTQLRQLGYEVATAASGAEGLELLKGQTAFDLLFTDVVLGRGLSGVEIAKRARAMRPGLRLLLTSGYSDDVVEELGVGQGLRLLRKPYRRWALAEAISAALQEPGEGAEPDWPQGPSAVVSLGATEASGPGATPEGEARMKLSSGPMAGPPPRRRLAGQAR